MEVENVSLCEDSVDTEPPAEVATRQEVVSAPRQQRTDAGNHSPQTRDGQLLSSAQSRARSISARSRAAERTSQQTPTDAQRSIVVSQSQNSNGHSTAGTLLSAGTQQSSTLVPQDNSAGESGASQRRHTLANQGSACVGVEQRMERHLSNIEEPPPLYSNLFPGTTVPNATNRHEVQHGQTHFLPSVPTNYASQHHSMSLSGHLPCNHHFPLHHCSAGYPFSHCSHHTSILLPGETGHCSQDTRQPTVRI